MKKPLQMIVCVVALFCIVDGFPALSDAVGHGFGDQRVGVDTVHTHHILEKTESLEEELRELRHSINTNRQNIATLSRKEQLARDGQPEFANGGFDEELTEVRPLDVPLDAHNTDDVTASRRYATSTLRPTDVDDADFDENDAEGEVEDEEDSENSGDDAGHKGEDIEERKRGYVDEEGEDDDDDDDDDDDNNDNDEDDEDDEDEDEEEMRRKKDVKLAVNKVHDVTEPSRDAQSKVIRYEGIVKRGDATLETTSASAEAPRDALLRNLEVFFGSKKDDHREADFHGVDNIQHIREIDKRVNLQLKEKYVNAVNPKADEDLLELMVKIAENPQEWQNIHGILQQLDGDLVASRDAVLRVKGEHGKQPANKRDEDSLVKSKPNPNNMTKEERKHQQAEKKKKKKKKQRQKEREERQREREKNKNRANGKEKSEEDLRRQQLTKAGVLSSDTSSIKSERPKEKHLKPRPLTSTTVRPTQAATTQVKAVPPTTINVDTKTTPQSKENNMKTISSTIDYLSKSEPKIITHYQNPKPKSPMQEVREKWTKTLSEIQPQINTAKAIVSGRLRPADVNGNRIRYFDSTEDKAPSTATESNGWSKSNIASESIQDKDRARERFLKDTVVAKSNVVKWKPNVRAKWLETQPLPAKEQRANPNNNYYNGNPTFNVQNDGWPDFSVDSLKHGNNIGKTLNAWPNLNIEEQNSNIEKTWPQLPVDPVKDADDWPDFQPVAVNTASNSADSNIWNKYQSTSDSTLTKHREALAKSWSDLPHEGAPLVDHAKDVSGAANNKPWPHFAYHRVTSSPHSLALQQQVAQQRARHRSAYIAVSIIAPPRKNSTSDVVVTHQQPITAQRAATIASVSDETRNQSRLPDKMDQLMWARGHVTERLTPIDPLEEQLIDMAAAGAGGNSDYSWKHSKQLDKLQEQLKTLSEMEAKLRFQWLEKERLRQTLRDGEKSGREPRAADSSLLSSTSAPHTASPVNTTHT